MEENTIQETIYTTNNNNPLHWAPAICEWRVLDVEDQQREVRVGSKVTFGGVTAVEDTEPYYVTVENDQADGSSESNTEVEAL